MLHNKTFITDARGACPKMECEGLGIEGLTDKLFVISTSSSLDFTSSSS